MKFFAAFEQDNTTQSGLGNFDVSKTFTFSTQLNGGFSQASMTISMPRTQGSMLSRLIVGSICTVYDNQGNYVYSGRVSNAASESLGVKVSCSGIFEDGGKKTVPTALWLSPTTTNGEIVADCVNLVPSWYGGVNVSNMNVPVGAQDYNDESKVNSMIASMLKVGYRTDSVKPAYFVLYNNQVAQIVVEQGSQYPNWFTVLGGKVGSSVGIQDVYNKIYILYDDTAEDSVGPTMYPTAAEDLGSQSKYGIREGVLNVGEYGLGLGLDLRDLAIQKYSTARSSVPITAAGYIKNGSGSYSPSYMARAGQLMGISNNDENAALHTLSEWDTSGFITATSFSASNMQSKYTLSNSDKRLDYLLARLGLSGGLG